MVGRVYSIRIEMNEDLWSAQHPVIWGHLIGHGGALRCV